MSAETHAWIRDYLDKITAQDAEGASAYFADDLVAHFLGESQLAGDYNKACFAPSCPAGASDRMLQAESSLFGRGSV